MKPNCELRGTLEGLKQKSIDAVFFKRASKIEKILNCGMAATAADTNGAINIYKTDAGKIFCEYLRNCLTLDEKVFTSIEEVSKWAKKWLKEIK